jgi:hypothetical protein
VAFLFLAYLVYILSAAAPAEVEASGRHRTWVEVVRQHRV